MHPDRFFKKLKIRTKLLLSYALVFVLTIGPASFVMYSVLRRTVEANIESELKNSTEALLNMVRTSVSVSIKNHLRAVAEKNLEMVQHLYNVYLQGGMTEAQSRQMAIDLLISQKIGTTGYIACVNSQGVMVVHPEKEWIDVDITEHAFVRKMVTARYGYIEYNWKNPGESHARPKAMYMTYFKPWDWIISVSSYRKEFRTLVEIEDFNASVLALKFGHSGYSFVTDRRGNIIIHPFLRGINIFGQSEMSKEPLKAMLEQKNGKTVYTWRNPGESRARKKIVIFNYIPEYEWIVASSSYLDEFYSPVETISHVIVFSLLGSVMLVLPISFWIGASFTDPLGLLIDRMGAKDAPHNGQRPESLDEIDQLTFYFNQYQQRLEKYSQSLHAEIAERRQAEEALRVSEERYRSVMAAAPDPIIVYDMEGRVMLLNPAFTDVFGWALEECLGNRMDHFVPQENWEETRQGLKIITAGQKLTSVETRRYTKDGRKIDVSIRGAVYRDRHGKPMGSVIIHRDVSDLKRLEKEIMDIGDRERQRIGQDLHDDLCPHLIGIEGLGKVLKNKLSATAPAESRMAGKITALIKDATVKTRQLARGLCPVHLVDHGLESSLRELSVNARSVFGIQCELNCEHQVLIGDNTVATHIFRIVQEAIHNAVRHGRANRVTITLKPFQQKVSLTVADDGCGMPEAVDTSGMGLRIMGFRAKIIDAALDIRSQQGKGTVVRLMFGENVITTRQVTRL